MRVVRVSGTIRRPVQDVFGLLSDPENGPKWSLNALEEKLTSPRPVSVGSTRRAVVKRLGGGTIENNAVCTEFEANRKLPWQSTPSPIPFHVELDFTPIDGGTRVDSIWTWEPKGFVRPVSPVLHLKFKRAMRKDVEYLKALMEAGALRPSEGEAALGPHLDDRPPTLDGVGSAN